MVQFGALRDLARRELTDCLDKYTGKKVSMLIFTIAGRFHGGHFRS